MPTRRDPFPKHDEQLSREAPAEGATTPPEPTIGADQARRPHGALAAVLSGHILFGFVWLVVFLGTVFLTSSYSGTADLVFVLGCVSWLGALPIIGVGWRSGGRWFWGVPLVWVIVFAIATVAVPLEAASTESGPPLPGTACALRSPPAQSGQPQAGGASLIAFASDRNGDFQIYVMNADGSGQRRLTRNATTDTEPAWSPDGTKIAFTRRCWHSNDKYDTDREIYVMNADGSGQRNLTRARLSEDESPAWSPDGTKIVFESDRGGGALPELGIFVMNADGSGQRRLTRQHTGRRSSDPSWSPDGGWIAFDSDRDGNVEVYTMAADGSRLRRLTRNPAYDYAPAWSPDGSTIAFTSERNESEEIYLVHPDGSGERRLTHGGGEAAAWLPDGTKISFETCSSCADGHGRDDFYVVNADGSRKTRLMHASADDLAWRP